MRLLPYHALTPEADPEATRPSSGNTWNGHVPDWAMLDINRHRKPGLRGKLWQNEDRGGEVFFRGAGLDPPSPTRAATLVWRPG